MESTRKELAFMNHTGVVVRGALLQEFERGLNPLYPELSKIPCRILGYGEISTVFEIQVDGLQNLAFKRMCIFKTREELQTYLSAYVEYNRRLEDDIGLHLPEHGYIAFECDTGRPVFYIIQKKLPPGTIANHAIGHLLLPETIILFRRILGELHKVWEYNRAHPSARVGIDGQISNWSIAGFDPDHPGLDENLSLVYVDTSTPLCYIDGVEQLNPELLLRSAPPYLVWILRLLFVKDVMTRYYDTRKVIIDLIANFYKEQKPDLIPDVLACANDFIMHQGMNLGIQPIIAKEVENYYQEDKLIWSMYLSMRRFDRFMRKKVLHRDYPYILPGEIKR